MEAFEFLIGYEGITQQDRVAISQLVEWSFSQPGAFLDQQELQVIENIYYQLFSEHLYNQSTGLNHTETIPHGMRHVLGVTRRMVDLNDKFSLLGRFMERKYGRYARVAIVLAGLFHDTGYVKISRLGYTFPRLTFSGIHCYASSVVLNRITRFAAEWENEEFEKMIEGVSNVIRRHGDKFTEEEPLFASDYPLLALLQIADKTDRVGSERLSPLQQSSDFQEITNYLVTELCKSPVVLEIVNEIKEIEKLIIDKLAITEIIDRRINAILSLEQLDFCFRQSVAVSIQRREKSNLEELDVISLYERRFVLLMQLDRIKHESNILKIAFEKLEGSSLSDLEVEVFRAYLSSPMAPFTQYGDMAQEVESFMGIRSIEYDHFSKGLGIRIVVMGHNNLAERIRRGLEVINIMGRSVAVSILDMNIVHS